MEPCCDPSRIKCKLSVVNAGKRFFSCTHLKIPRARVPFTRDPHVGLQTHHKAARSIHQVGDEGARGDHVIGAGYATAVRAPYRWYLDVYPEGNMVR